MGWAVPCGSHILELIFPILLVRTRSMYPIGDLGIVGARHYGCLRPQVRPPAPVPVSAPNLAYEQRKSSPDLGNLYVGISRKN